MKPDRPVTMDASKVAICYDHESIFDASYGAGLRRYVGATGWGHIETYPQILQCLRRLYWFPKEKENQREVLRISGLYLKHLEPKLRRTVFFNTIIQMRNIFIKRTLAFPEMGVSYDEYYIMFEALYKDLLPCFAQDEEGDIEKCKIYLEMKDGFSFFKRYFHHEDYEERSQILDHEFKSEGLFNAFTVPIRQYSLDIANRYYYSGEDETKSVSWSVRWAMLCQTRMLGKFPKPLAKAKVQDYLEKIQETREASREKLIAAKDHLERWLREGPIRTNFLNEGKFDDEKVRELRDSCWNKLSLRLKFTASTDITRREGGKAEEARKLLNKARVNGWKVPRRDLMTGQIVDMIDISFCVDEGPLYEYLFWLSFQLVINELHDNYGGKSLLPYIYPFKNKDGSLYTFKVFRTRVEGINEPGKLRMLVKTTGVLYWFLTPMGEILNECLSFMKEHYSGLKGSSQGWRFQKELSGKGSSSSLIYDEDWKKRDGLFFGFLDLTEATDFIPRNIGLTMLTVLMEYIGIGKFWSAVTRMALKIDLPVDRVTISSQDGDTNEISEPKVIWKGFIRSGFMMGMPVTKTVLHLVHALADQKTLFLAEEFYGMRRVPYGPVIKPNFQYQGNFKPMEFAN
jgi:hypothetical protein